MRLRLFLCLLSWAAAVPSAAAETKPNILFCFADDWGRFASIYSSIEQKSSPNNIVKTPNIDRVAREGVLFRNAFVNAPSCTPCRSALVSGRYFFQTGRGAILSGARWDPTIPAFPLLLHDAGYHIGETFKVWSPGAPNDAPFGAGKFAYEKRGGGANNFSENVSAAVARGESFESAAQKIYDDVGANFDAFLADRKSGQPWLYWFGPTTVHRMWQKGSGQALWGINPDDLKGKMPACLPDVPEVRADFADYLGEIQAFDAYVGVLLERLERTGELDRTVIVLSGDHGPPGFPDGKCNLYDFGVRVTLAARWPGRKGGRVVDDLVNLRELAPTFLEIGGVAIPEGVTAQSLVPLLKSEASGQVDPERTWTITGRERHVGTAREGNLPYPQRALRTKDFLYIRNFKPDRWPLGSPAPPDKTPTPAQLELDTRVAYADLDSSPTKAWLVAHQDDEKWKPYFHRAFAKRPGEELYDMRRDPDQQHNVADDPAYKTQKKELSERLMNVLTEHNDPRVTGTGDTFEKPPFTD